jgi:hypothetical protein
MRLEKSLSTDERRVHAREFLVMRRRISDFEGTHRGNLRTRETWRNVCTRC